MRNRIHVHASIATLAVTALATAAHATDWLQFGYDAAHSSFNPVDHSYSTATGNVILTHYTLPNAAEFARAWGLG